ncbi:MAG TPA: hypothetical protein VF680_16685 [Allosphingosinicella sp.]|jgi:hypothetical protein
MHATKQKLARSLELLLVEFSEFSYENAGTRHPKDWLIDLSPSFASWQQRVRTTIKFHFTPQSAPYMNIERADGRPLIGNAQEGFLWVMARYQEALVTGLAATKDDIHCEIDPARFQGGH